MLFNKHLSYISFEVIRTCIANKIILLYLLPYSTYLLQPLNISLFSLLAQLYKNII